MSTSDPETTRQPKLSKPAELLRALQLRTSSSLLRPVWGLSYRSAAMAAAAYLRRGQPDIALYSLGEADGPDVVFGVSDIDLAVVAPRRHGRPGERRGELLARWERLCARWPALGRLIGIAVYELPELERAMAATPSRWEAEGGSGTNDALLPPSTFTKPPDSVLRAGFGLPRGSWRLLGGPDRVPPALNENHDPRISAWLELQHWWRHAFGGCVDPSGPHTAYLCVKLVAEPARILIWLTRGERVESRRNALEQAASLVPEEAETFARALALQRALHRSPTAPLAEMLAGFLRLSQTIVRLLTEQVASAGHTDVVLEWDGPAEIVRPAGSQEALRDLIGTESTPVPLADWRSLAYPSRSLDETFTLTEGDPGDPSRVAALARATTDGSYPGLALDDLLLLPAWTARQAKLRGVHSRLSDPASFALLEGATVARFANLAGWSIHTIAARATAEHRAWLAEARADVEPWEMLSTLLSCAKAAVLLESVEAGAPALPLTLHATALRLGNHDESLRDLALTSWECYAAWQRGGVLPPVRLPAQLRAAILGLGAYRRLDVLASP